jgi:V/A-type H+-transporting ATPase subunit I
MKKVSVVVLNSARREAVAQLRKLGIAHLEQLSGNSGELSKLRDDYAALDGAFSVLGEFKVPKKQGAGERLTDARIAQTLEKSRKIVAAAERKRACFEAITQNTAELERFAKWGALDPADLAYLAEKGVYLSLYEIPAGDYGAIPESVRTIRVSGDKTQTRFLVIGEGSRARPAELPASALAVADPKVSTAETTAEIERLKKEVGEIDKTLLAEAADKADIDAARKKLAKDIEFENVYSGMYDDVAEGERGSNLAWLSGFVPAADIAALKKAAAEEHWALAVDDPADEDPVPTKLKNNALVSLIYPLTDFLETVPGYHEYDISGWFLLFFCIFFGMIFGDAGYGSLLALIGIIGIFASVAKGKKAPAGLKMLLLLAISNIAWGVMTCTWFGVKTEYLPSLLKDISIPAISNTNTDETALRQNLQIVCFTIALVQLCIAHVKNVFRALATKGIRLKFLSELGQIAMLFAMYHVVLILVPQIKPENLPLQGNMIIYVLVAGFAASFIFANYEGSIGKSILASLSNIISVVLGITNVFSDIMSYIRLWAVGLAGSSISSVVNDMAGPTLGSFLIFAGILLLVFGHGLNIILNVLSVLVHGVRLNTLEFSSHLGVSWSGIAYRPFKEAVK